MTESANRASHGDDIDNSLKVDNADGHLLQASQNVPTPPPPLPENAAQVTSSLFYTSCSLIDKMLICNIVYFLIEILVKKKDKLSCLIHQ